MTVIFPRDTPISPFLLPEAGVAWEKIRKLGVERDFSPGGYLYREGDLPTYLHNLHSGRMRVFIGHPDGLERTIAFAGPQTTFGEYGIFDNVLRCTSAVAMEPPCHRSRRSDSSGEGRFEYIVGSRPPAGSEDQTDDHASGGRRRACAWRDSDPFARRIWVVDPDKTVRLSESHRVDDLAQLIGVTRVTMSRELSRLVAIRSS
jgi:CRP/FNR family cyclic AMP-dependent transcriptional regulator